MFGGRSGAGSQSDMPPSPDDAAALRTENAHLRAVVEELRGAVAELRKQVESQQAHIHKLVKLTFGRSSERVVGATLFDGTAPPESPAPPPPVPAGDPPKTPRTRTGHGRRRKPADLPRERVEIDLTEAEKACPCCREMRVRIGEDVAERLDYRPASLFVRELVFCHLRIEDCAAGFGRSDWRHSGRGRHAEEVCRSAVGGGAADVGSGHQGHRTTLG